MNRFFVGRMAAVVATSAAAFATGASVASAGQPVQDTVRKVDRTVKKVAGQGQGVTGQLKQRTQQGTGRLLAKPQQQRAASGVRPRQATPGSPGGYQPPLHGTNPHGQGTVATADLAPTGQRPLSGNPAGGQPQIQNNEEAVAGRARGEKDAQGYHGHITILALFGNEVLGVDTRPGQTRQGPLDAVQQGLLDPICTGSNICLEVLAADSTTTSNSSTNRFAVANARVGAPGPSPALSATAGESRGNASEDANCQRSSGSSRAANVSAGATPLAQVANSSSSSTSCNDGSGSVQQDSEVLGTPALLGPACATGAETGPLLLPPLLTIVCNANDTNGVGEPVMQAAQRYGVREALTVFALDVGGTSLTKLTASASESRSEAPGGGPNGPPDDGNGGDDGDDGGDTEDGDDRGGRGGRGGTLGGGGGAGGDAGGAGRGAGGDAAQCEDGIDNDGDGRVDFPNDPGCSSANDDSEANQLAFTGLNAFALLALGLLAVPAGLRLRKVTRSATS